MILDYEQRAIAMLESQFQNTPNLHAVVRMIAREIQALEYAIWSVEVGRYLAGATGAQLDQWGAILGAVRGDLSDADFRRVIRARILVNISAGTVEDLLAVFAALADAEVRVDELPPNTLLFYTILGALDSVAIDRVKKYLGTAKKAGIRIFLIDSAEDFFGFFDNPDALGFDAGRLARVI